MSNFDQTINDVSASLEYLTTSKFACVPLGRRFLAEIFSNNVTGKALCLYDAEGKGLLKEPFRRLPAIERRLSRRFPLELLVRYRTAGRKRYVAGDGLAVNISSGGALVISKHEVRVGTRVKLSIEWPSLLEGRIPLQLVTLSRVVRTAGAGFAVRFERHQFHTLRSGLQPISAPIPNGVR